MVATRMMQLLGAATAPQYNNNDENNNKRVAQKCAPVAQKCAPAPAMTAAMTAPEHNAPPNGSLQLGVQHINAINACARRKQ